MPRHHELHLFLDESGSFSVQHQAPTLVGGVAILGDYGPEADSQLLQILQRRLSQHGGHFPADLHFFDSRLKAGAREAFLSDVRDDLRTWQGDLRWACGVSIVHDADLFTASGGILAERGYDNRYVLMVLALVEHLLFVDACLAVRLTPDVKVHLHVAHRVFFLARTEGLEEELLALGYRSQVDQKTGRLKILDSLTMTELRGMLRVALRQRWPRSEVQLSHVEVPTIDYQAGRSAAALYLADMYLGQRRLLERAKIERGRPKTNCDLFSEQRWIHYGPAVEAIAEMQAAALNGEVDGYLSAHAKYDAVGDASGQLAETLHRQELLVGETLAGRTAEPLVRYLDNACRIVDQPGRREEGIRQADTAVRLLKAGSQHDVRAEVLALQVQISCANHSGRIGIADDIWKAYVQREPELICFGAEGLRLQAELRNRRAVSLTDQFRYNEAESVLNTLISTQQGHRASLARAFGIDESHIPSRELGACFGTLGQLYALHTGTEWLSRAESCFREALSLFTQPSDIERQWIYLGHLACDQAEAGLGLWNAVTTQLPELIDESPICRDGGQFVLALQLKGQLLFSSTAKLIDYLDRWESRQTVAQYPQESAKCHPFGLIHQAAALNYARVWRETQLNRYVAAALESFDRAIEHLTSTPAGHLLTLLGYACRIRRHLFRLEADPDSQRPRQAISKALSCLKAHVMECFGDEVWCEDEHGRSSGILGQHDSGPGSPLSQRARGIVQTFRFNYW